MEIGRDLATFVVGLVTSAVAALGVWASRRGTSEQAKQAAAAHEYQALRDRADRAEAGEARERHRAQACEDELDEQRDEWRKRFTDQEQTHRAELIATAAKCRTELMRLEDTLRLMHKVVKNEVAKVAAEQALMEVKGHPHDDVDDWLNGDGDVG